MAITTDQLKGSYGEREAQALYHELKAVGDYIGFIQQMMYADDYQVVRNAFWVLTKATDNELSQLQPILHKLIDLALTTPNSSVRRLSLNIIERLKISEDDLRTDFFDFCIEHMTDVNELPGIQSICMKLAYHMSAYYPELNDELIRIVDGMEIEYYKPAVRSARSRILRGTLKRTRR